jgi:hypothetical protein
MPDTVNIYGQLVPILSEESMGYNVIISRKALEFLLGKGSEEEIKAIQEYIKGSYGLA